MIEIGGSFVPARIWEIQQRFGTTPSRLAGGWVDVPDPVPFEAAYDRAAALGDLGPATVAAAALPAAPTLATTGPAAPTTGAGAGAGATPYAELFSAAGARHGVPPALLSAVAEIESGFNPDAVSPAGARGLMQFMPQTAAGMGVDPSDPASSVDGAARLLRSHLDRFGSWELALAAYNAGPGAVTRHGGIPPFTETQNYVRKVMERFQGGAQ